LRRKLTESRCRIDWSVAMRYSLPHMLFGLALMSAGAMLLMQQGCQRREPAAPRAAQAEIERPAVRESAAERQGPPHAMPWKSLFDGESLAGWKAPQFGGEGKVYVEKGAIVMETGSSMTGVTWTGDVPRNNYELSLEGMKLEGSDFFCTTTFPVGDDPCSLVVGGWGGGVVGLSNVDFHDASNNPTMKIIWFKEKQWYRVRIRVSDAAIEAWIDDEQLINQPRKGHKFGIRSEVELCCPLGICTWVTKGAVRNIRIRALEAAAKAVDRKR
jgi:hypothetical protein